MADKAFNDRLSWFLMLPLAALAAWAAGIAVMFLELALEGDEPGSAARATRPLMAFAAAYCAVLLGGKVAPEHKVRAGAGLALGYLAALVALGLREASGAWLRAEVLALGAAGAAAALWRLGRAPRSASAQARAEGDVAGGGAGESG